MRASRAIVADGPAKGVVLSKAVLKAADRLEVSSATLARIIGVSPSQVTRIRQGMVSLEPGNKPYELAALFVRVYRSLDALTGGDDAISAKWLDTDNTVLNAKPIDLIQEVAGMGNVIRYLGTRRAIV